MLIKNEKVIKDVWGISPYKRSIPDLINAGFLILDKPSGPPSNQVTSWVKNIFKIKKISHGGTLDPNVSGVLPICLGKSVKLQNLVLSPQKEYVCLLKLHKKQKIKDIIQSVNFFKGKIKQTPPLKSSVKNRKQRIRNILNIKILTINSSLVLFKVLCSAGTYIRTLCTSIGDQLGCKANMLELRRISSGSFQESISSNLQKIKDSFSLYEEHKIEKNLRSILFPIEFLTKDLPKIIVKASSVHSICNGFDLNVQGIHMLDETIKKNSIVTICNFQLELIAIGTSLYSSSCIFNLNEGKIVKINSVFMSPTKYPNLLSSK